MLHAEPAWTYAPRHALTIGDGRLHLLPEHVIGQWFCLDRKSGEPLWDRAACQADDVVGVSEGVIVAREEWAQGPTSSCFGAFGISLQTGELLWESHYDHPGRGRLWGRILRLLPIAHRDYALAVRGAECLTMRGRVLDIHTGEETRHESSPKSWPETAEREESPSYRLYRRQPVDCGQGRILRHGTPEKPAKEGSFPDGTFRFFLNDASGSPQWTFDFAQTGHFINGNYYSYRLAGAWIYMVVSDRPQRIPIDPARPAAKRKNPAQYFLWTLDLDTGQVCQQIRLSEEDVTHCSIQDLDDGALLIRCDDRAMLYLRQGQRPGGEP